MLLPGLAGAVPLRPCSEDVCQILAYRPPLGIPSGHLVQVAGGPPRVLTVHNAGVHIHNHVIPPKPPGYRILTSVETVATEIAASLGR